jgi:hypothetical protein
MFGFCKVWGNRDDGPSDLRIKRALGMLEDEASQNYSAEALTSLWQATDAGEAITQDTINCYEPAKPGNR